MYFDGAHSKAGSGADIVIISLFDEYLLFALRLQFTCTNNIAEYEAPLLGLEADQFPLFEYGLGWMTPDGVIL